MSVFFRRLESLPWTPYLDKCCDKLQAGPVETDKSVVALIRVQLIAERVSQGPWHAKSEIGGDNIAPVLHIRAIQEQIKSLKSSMLPMLGDQGQSSKPCQWSILISKYCS